MQERPVILKLGGSVITDKRSGNPVVKTTHVRQLARVIAKTRVPLILLYGGGSFGHPLAHQYKLSDRVLSPAAIMGVAKTVTAMRALGGTLTEIFLSEGVPVVPLQTSSLVYQRGGKLVITNYSLIEEILAYGGVPLLGGDVMLTDQHRTAIVSADQLATELARHFHSHKILFATDVDGVYEKFPPRGDEQPLSEISRAELRTMRVSRATQKGADVTGAMGGKLQSLLPLRQTEVIIFNGLKRGTLAEVLRGKKRGTRISL